MHVLLTTFANSLIQELVRQNVLLKEYFENVNFERGKNRQQKIHTVLPARSDSDVMFCLQSCQGLRIDGSLVY